jgi:hypothetical protein
MADQHITDKESDVLDMRGVQAEKVYRFFSMDGFSFNGLVIAQVPKLTLIKKAGPPAPEYALVEVVIITGTDTKGGLQLVRTGDMRPLHQVGWIAKAIKVLTIQPTNGKEEKPS